MNKVQKIILWIGTLAICAMIAYPHWISETGGSINTDFGYSSLFSPRIIPAQIDVTRLIWQIILVAIPTLAGVMTTGTPRDKQ